ncbi:MULTISPECIES: ABC transporter permease [Clostridium]|uniref:Putative aliphatic sulfonates transport permease protein SsuC n=2 Tax=Clostridium TaxID=1485 RepID=A0A151ALT2_9CLOT|nr:MULTISPECIES: ABC transporter permease subunit [Clostridium]KYH28367.1 putative aliphatic sulfonates transport permease protein SsuC [Clostridium colicanis DSM 13634]MBE6043577.1 ABC transporter permease subunit [Clostridium thermopalmarium]PRR68809.1 putative aliphatic sulfonates transport permease protein SsuC [Clostridium thermopalmarium DSM 5974]PVZ22609.1 NitT/TauT family transport system permease protein [Clostridium thermopalmarium DSM 5974]
MKISIIKKSRKITILIFWLLIWELCSLFVNQSLFLPSPLEVLKVLLTLITETYFWKSVFSSISRVIIGLFLSIVIGIIAGVASGLNKFIEEILNPLILGIRAIPVMSIIILALVWFKSYYVSVFTAILTCFPIVYTNVVEGIKNVDIKLIEMAQIYKVKKKYIIKDIYLPSIRPYIVSGVLMCLGLGFKVTVSSEVLSTPKYSIGLNLLNSKSMLDTSELFAWTIVVILFSFIFERTFKSYIEKIDKRN